MSAFLEASDIAYRVRERALVEGATVRVESGEVACVVGPNGAGKSTLLKLLSGEFAPGQGSVAYGGRLVSDEPAWRLACLRAVLPQVTRLFLPLSVADVASLGLDGIGRRTTPHQRTEWLRTALDTAEVTHLATRNYQTLSGGEQQRVQFARVLCQLSAGRTVEARQVLLLDEPTANLDLSHQIALLVAARRLAREGLAVLMILHDLNLAAAFADRMIAMRDGRIVADGPPRSVLTGELMRDVFGIGLQVGATPNSPFVLPCRDAIDP